MNTNEQIQQSLNEETARFYEKKYDGKLSIPFEFPLLFKIAISNLSSYSHKINFHKVKSISKKTSPEYTFGDLHEIIKVLLNTPLNKLYPHMEESEGEFIDAIDEHIKVEKFVIEFNQIIDKFKSGLEMKRRTLQDLAGKPSNSMRIIPAQA